jgi:hypothetical protein
MATLSDHVAAVQAAIMAAYEDGYLLQGWPDDYSGGATLVDLMFVKNKRGADGVMRNEERARIETVYL